MDEVMQQNSALSIEESEAETTTETKQLSLKAARSALKRMESDLDKKTEQISDLKKEISKLKPQIRNMKTQIEQLEQEETLKKVQDAMRTKSKRMTSTQVQAALDLIQQLDNGDLEHLDIQELVGIIHKKASDKKEQSMQQKVDTSVNFSEKTNSLSDMQETEGDADNG